MVNLLFHSCPVEKKKSSAWEFFVLNTDLLGFACPPQYNSA